MITAVQLSQQDMVEVAEMVTQAVTQEEVSPEKVQKLWKKGLLEPTPPVTNYVTGDGQAHTLAYDYTENVRRTGGYEMVRFIGFLGFDHGLELVAVDERAPAVQRKCLLRGSWTPLD